jgi:hypothetical protein
LVYRRQLDAAIVPKATVNSTDLTKCKRYEWTIELYKYEYALEAFVAVWQSDDAVEAGCLELIGMEADD